MVTSPCASGGHVPLRGTGSLPPHDYAGTSETDRWGDGVPGATAGAWHRCDTPRATPGTSLSQKMSLVLAPAVPLITGFIQSKLVNQNFSQDLPARDPT
jgi:hypothetical protein